MPFVKIWIHAVWSTKNRKRLLTQDIRKQVFRHIHQNGLNKGIYIDIVNGYSDHVHCLFRLRSNQTIEKVMQLLKGESSFWINKEKLTKTHFGWQSEYYAVSVSESQTNRVREYIKRQEEHHHKISTQEEFNEFIKKFGFTVFGDNL